MWTILRLHLPNEDVWNYQFFITTREKNIHVRYWNHEAEEPHWSEWVNITGTQYLGMNALTPDTPAHDPRVARKITYTTITRYANDGFPENKSGVLKTVAFTIDRFAHQIYNIYNDNKVYKRTWINSASGWGDWKLVQDEVMIHNKGIGFDAAKQSTEYDLGITIEVINASVGDVGQPEGETGTVITTKTANEEVGRYAYQEFMINGTDKVYKRVLQKSGNWSGWHLNKTVFIERGFNAAKLAEEYPIGVTYNYVTSLDGDVGLPGNKTGIIETVKTAEQELGRYAYQTFKVNGSFDEYSRHLMSDGSWSGWGKYVIEQL